MTSQNYYEQKGGAGFYGFVVFALCSLVCYEVTSWPFHLFSAPLMGVQ